MKNEHDNHNLASIIFGTLLVLSIIYIGVYHIIPPKEITVEVLVEPPVEKPKAMVYTHFTSWAEEEGNENGYIFSYFVYNFGDAEAKDVVVQCTTFDQNGNLVKRTTKPLGNLASHSEEYDELYEDFFVDTTDYIGYCVTKSCGENCEVLEERIPSLEEYL